MLLREITIGKTELMLVMGNILDQPVASVVNPANQSLLGGGGLDGMIHRVAGPSLREACKMIPVIRSRCRIEVGSAIVTEAFNLHKYNRNIQFIVHTVGPNCENPIQSQNRKNLLETAYFHSLVASYEKRGFSIAFPAISTGSFGYPFLEAQAIAFKTIKNYIEMHSSHFERIVFVMYQIDDQNIISNLEKLWDDVYQDQFTDSNDFTAPTPM
ncbi:MAG: macro domain-containing protein [Chlamydiia bacterium]|nr:macro domain-containing protein [Chlamydiia bacterium]